ncbi:hypothetical protein ACFLYB_03030 [Chloroflexota bacterium]
MNKILFIPAALLGLGIINLLIGFVVRKKRLKRYKQKSKLTNRKLFEWILLIVSALYLFVWAPISTVLPIDISLVGGILQVGPSMIGILGGVVLIAKP